MFAVTSFSLETKRYITCTVMYGVSRKKAVQFHPYGCDCLCVFFFSFESQNKNNAKSTSLRKRVINHFSLENEVLKFIMHQPDCGTHSIRFFAHTLSYSHSLCSVLSIPKCLEYEREIWSTFIKYTTLAQSESVPKHFLYPKRYNKLCVQSFWHWNWSSFLSRPWKLWRVCEGKGDHIFVTQYFCCKFCWATKAIPTEYTHRAFDRKHPFARSEMLYFSICFVICSKNWVNLWCLQPRKTSNKSTR